MENGIIGNRIIEKWNFKDAIGKIGKWNWIYWKMELETLKDGVGNGIGNVGKWNCEYFQYILLAPIQSLLRGLLSAPNKCHLDH